jgi:hypothetical protein
MLLAQTNGLIRRVLILFTLYAICYLQKLFILFLKKPVYEAGCKINNFGPEILNLSGGLLNPLIKAFSNVSGRSETYRYL